MNQDVLLQPRRILVIDDNDAIHADFRKILRGNAASEEMASDEEALFGPTKPKGPQIEFLIDSASQGQEGYAKVAAAMEAKRPYQVAFVDMRMPPGWDGVQTISRLWELDPQLQVVICTAYSDYSWEQIIDNLGATDRLLILKKPFDDLEVSQLATALTAKRLVTDQATMKLAELEQLVQARTAELKQASLLDKLTGLPNRELLNDRVNQLIHQASRHPERKFAVLFLDFDRFKVVNDSLGHEIGDLLLVNIAQRLRRATRLSDSIAKPPTAARLGGDEFVVVLDELAEFHDAVRVAERLLTALSEPHDLKGHLVHSTASIGIATNACAYTCADDMLRDADTAMYHAKASGKARCVMFDQRMHDEAMARLTLEGELRNAIDTDQLFLQYQPIISLRSGEIRGFEALVRWRHPTRGVVPPLEFIPLAEEIGTIVPLGYMVLRQACQQLAQWRSKPELPRVHMSINLSRRQLGVSGLVPKFVAIAAEHGISPGEIKLEITESAVMEDPAAAVRVLEEFRSAGFDLHLDDFGTGYSSLSCLHRFPISGLKIDRAFINNVGERRDYAAVINAIISLTHNLNIHLVAEGVETRDQLVMLQTMECDEAQGYYFAKPMDAPAAEAFLRDAANLVAAKPPAKAPPSAAA